MSFTKLKSVIERGDTVILYLSVNSMFPIRVEPQVRNRRGEMVEHVFQTVYGALRVAELEGLKFGSKVKLSRGWAFALAPTCDLWTLSLPHRTQILYSTGSGSLSHAILRTVKPNGSLLTFDFHEDRASIAREEFESHGYIPPLVKVFHRDVCKLGFCEKDEKNGVVDEEMPDVSSNPVATTDEASTNTQEKADAVFLDLPHPWLAIPHAKQVLKKGGRLVTFSPCIEQVQKSKEAMLQNGFFEICTTEGLSRELQVQYRTHPRLALSTSKPGQENVKYLTSIPAATVPGHTGFLTFATLKP
ncbi:hypothetical protein B566_EDAN014234 [Ephemera danica]|nr:hypothetical protein B566_EDAN014234 [Ephemera danica]